MIHFGNLTQQDDVVEEQLRYRGDNEIFQEAKKAKKEDDDFDIENKYDTKYDLEDEPDTEIEPVKVDVDEDDDDREDDKKDDEKESDQDDDSDDEESDTKDEDDKDQEDDETDEDDKDNDEHDEDDVDNVEENDDKEKKDDTKDDKKDDETVQEAAVDNSYYSSIVDSANDLQHLYKTLMHRMSKEEVVEELHSLFNELRDLRSSHFEKTNNDDIPDRHVRAYKGMQRIVESDIKQIENNLKALDKKPNGILIKKTVKMMNRMQQDMISESEHSQNAVVKNTRDLTKKIWFFNSYNMDVDDGDEPIMEDVTIIKTVVPTSPSNRNDIEDDVFAKVGELMVKLRKQKELQELAEKSGVQINGMRYTDDTVMNIATAVVALMIAKNEGDPKYRMLVDQGMKKRSLKAELINAYKAKANELINQYDHGSSSRIMMGDHHDELEIEPEVISEDDDDDYHEEYYIDPDTGELKEYYQEMDESYDQSKHREIKDETISIEVKPCSKVGHVKFGDTRKKVQSELEDRYGNPVHSKEDEDDYGKFSIQYENNKAALITIKKDIEVTLDRSVVFPGNTDNIEKKALDIKDENGEMISNIMSISVKKNSDGTIDTISFGRKNYYIDQKFEKYDDVQSYINDGMDEHDAKKRLKEVYKFLSKHSLLTTTGKSEMKDINKDSVITSNELTDDGNNFMHQYYNGCKSCSHKEIYNKLEQCWEQFNGQSNDHTQPTEVKQESWLPKKEKKDSPLRKSVSLNMFGKKKLLDVTHSSDATDEDLEEFKQTLDKFIKPTSLSLIPKTKSEVRKYLQDVAGDEKKIDTNILKHLDPTSIHLDKNKTLSILCDTDIDPHGFAIVFKDNHFDKVCQQGKE